MLLIVKSVLNTRLSIS